MNWLLAKRNACVENDGAAPRGHRKIRCAGESAGALEGPECNAGKPADEC